MSLGDNLKKLRLEKNKTLKEVSNDIGLTIGYLSDLERNVKKNPTSEVLQKIADYYDVTTDWLLGKTKFRPSPNEYKLAEAVKRYEDFAEKDKKDIARTMNFLLEQLENNHQDALMFDGKVLDDETRELLKDSLLNSLKMGKLIAKQKFTPNKHKK